MVQELLYGINTILSLLKYNAGNRKIIEIIIDVKKKGSNRLGEIILEASKRNIPLKELESSSFEDILNDDKYTGSQQEERPPGYQGIIARVSEYKYSDLDIPLKNKQDKNSILVILDSITDVGNFGSILRNCSAFGVSGVIIPKRRSVELNPRLSKISSGALEEVKIYRVTNLVATITKLKGSGFWIYGTTLRSGKEIKFADKIDYTFPLAIIFGSEDRGMHRLVEKSCDFLISIQMTGHMQSLNVATATGIFLYLIRGFKDKH